jgi:hypothetical protein
MMVADVKVSWVLSVSQDVVSQVVVLKTVDGGVVSEVTLDAAVDSVVLEGLSQKTDYVVVHTVTDGTQDASASLQFNLGDLEAPQAVSGLAVEVVKVYNKE